MFILCIKLWWLLSIILFNLYLIEAVEYKFGNNQLVKIEEETRIGVCITGQIGRLELESKIKHIFKPLTDTKLVKVDVVIILGNESTTVHLNGHEDENQNKYTNVAEISSFLKNYTNKVRVVWTKQPNDPVANLKYRNNVGWWQYPRISRQYNRTRSHIRQWLNFRRCYDNFVELEFDNQVRYDAMMRMRDGEW